MIAYTALIFSAIAPWVCWAALLVSPAFLASFPNILLYGIPVTVVGFALPPVAAAYWGFVGAVVGFALIGLFGEIFLIPFALLTPVSLTLSAVAYYYALNT